MLLDILPWAAFLAFVFGMLAIDLGVFHRKAHEVRRKEALAWSAVWIGLAILFNIGVYLFQGTDRGIEWTTGYLIEKSLSVDNVFVFLLIFATFSVPPAYQHRVLFWGILGALVMRALLIGAAGFLLGSLHWVIYLFGAFLIFTGIRFLREQEHSPDLERNRLVRLARRIWPVTPGYEGQKFFVRRGGASSPRPSSSSSSSSKAPTSSSPSTPSRRSTLSPMTRSSSSRPTCSPSSACARSTSCSPGTFRGWPT